MIFAATGLLLILWALKNKFATSPKSQKKKPSENQKTTPCPICNSMLYQGENLGEEQSVIGEIDKEKIPVTGNSRFGCWICTMVREDKSLKTFIALGTPLFNTS